MRHPSIYGDNNLPSTNNDFIFNSVHARNYQKRKERCKYVALTLFILSSNVGSFLLGHYYNSLF